MVFPPTQTSELKLYQNYSMTERGIKNYWNTKMAEEIGLGDKKNKTTVFYVFLIPQYKRLKTKILCSLSRFSKLGFDVR